MLGFVNCVALGNKQALIVLTKVQKGVGFFCKSGVVVREFEVVGTENGKACARGRSKKNACGSKSSDLGWGERSNF